MSLRRALTAALVLMFEGYMYYRYAQFGAQFHFWLHGLFGGSLGLLALTAWRRRPAVGALAGGGVVLGVALLLRHPVPANVAEVRDHPGLAWMCPLTGFDVGGPAAGHPPQPTGRSG